MSVHYIEACFMLQFGRRLREAKSTPIKITNFGIYGPQARRNVSREAGRDFGKGTQKISWEHILPRPPQKSLSFLENRVSDSDLLAEIKPEMNEKDVCHNVS